MADPSINFQIVTSAPKGCKSVYVSPEAAAWMRDLSFRLSRIPSVRKAHRQMRNGHTQSVACKPAFRGRRHGW